MKTILNLIFTGFTSLILTCSVAADIPIPEEAKTLINRIHSAAGAKDLSTIKKLMTQEFTWSFGQEGNNANLAIKAWKSDPEYLHTLHQVTGQTCKYIDNEHVQCPAEAGMDFRAGFKKMPNGWRMVYFVAGD